MKIIITGASGTAGSEVLRQSLSDNFITEVFALVRKPTGIEHPKLKTILHNDFLNYEGLEDVFKKANACIWCLGISQTKVSKEDYHAITFDYTIKAAEAMLSANPSISFVFLSGMGADSHEKSGSLFARVKGKTENALKKMKFKQIHIARPGGIIAVEKRDGIPWFEKYLTPVMGFFAPSLVINTVQLAKALLKLAKEGYTEVILENKVLKKLGE
jgi:uncharacterized protein YbjT (DUF2867 family)